jgi:hypothetical protein
MRVSSSHTAKVAMIEMVVVPMSVLLIPMDDSHFRCRIVSRGTPDKLQRKSQI